MGHEQKSAKTFDTYLPGDEVDEVGCEEEAFRKPPSQMALQVNTC